MIPLYYFTWPMLVALTLWQGRSDRTPPADRQPLADNVVIFPTKRLNRNLTPPPYTAEIIALRRSHRN